MSATLGARRQCPYREIVNEIFATLTACNTKNVVALSSFFREKAAEASSTCTLSVHSATDIYEQSNQNAWTGTEKTLCGPIVQTIWRANEDAAWN